MVEKASKTGQKELQNGVFEAAYGKLNTEQKRAVDAIEGPVMIIAGPGTGKTQVLALRIANILRTTDTAPSSILALTFTESGVASMRARLVSLIGARGYEVRIHTFHGFCNTIISRYPERFARIVGAVPLIEIDALRHIETILDNGLYELLRPAGYPYLYVRDIKGALSDVKRENISPDDLGTRIVREREAIMSSDDLYHARGAHAGKMKGHYVDALKKLDKAEEFAAVYRAYELILSETHTYDFEDTILEAVRAMEKDDELKLLLQEEHQYVLADEHQDANGAQNRLLELLSDFHESPNLFIVGDEKQAIYRFQGASLANFLFFKEHYPSALCIELANNYRSTQVILDAAHDVIAPAAGHALVARPRLTAHAGHTHLPVQLSIFQEQDEELASLAEKVAAHVAAGVPAHEIAILCRRNSDAEQVASVLKMRGVPTALLNDAQILDIPLMRSLMALLRAVASFGSDVDLYPLLYAPFLKLDNLDIFRLTERKEISLFEMMKSEKLLHEHGIEHSAGVHAVFLILDDIAQFEKSTSLSNTVHYALERAHVLAYCMERDDRYVLLEYVRAFIRYVESLEAAHPTYRLADLMRSLDTAQSYGMSIMTTTKAALGTVRIFTVHKSKGMEFDHVYIPFMHEGRWGSSASRTKIRLPLYSETDAGDLDDERRLLYVAMTRARKSLTLSYAKQNTDGKELTPSRFLSDINADHIEEQELQVTAKDVLVPRTMLPSSAGALDRAYLVERFIAQGLSVSALNNYLESPWRYFFQNLLRIPTPKENHLFYGTAIDGAMKWLTKEEAITGMVSEEQLLSEFERLLARAPFSKADKAAYIKKGAASLTGYLKTYPLVGVRPVEAGVSVKVLFEIGVSGASPIQLRGEFDRIEHVRDGLVRVVDFKTGAPKSRNDIEGATKSSNGNYKRQLVFYALLASLDMTRGWRIEEGVIDFIEPDKKGNYHREVFTITHEEIKELEATIRRVICEIMSLSFFDTPCDASVWSEEGCALVAALKSKTR